MSEGEYVVHAREEKGEKHNGAGHGWSVDENGRAAAETAETDADEDAGDPGSLPEGSREHACIQDGDAGEELPEYEDGGVRFGKEEVPIHFRTSGQSRTESDRKGGGIARTDSKDDPTREVDDEKGSDIAEDPSSRRATHGINQLGHASRAIRGDESHYVKDSGENTDEEDDGIFRDDFAVEHATQEQVIVVLFLPGVGVFMGDVGRVRNGVV